MEVKSAIIPADPISFAYLVLPIYMYKVKFISHFEKNLQSFRPYVSNSSLLNAH